MQPAVATLLGCYRAFRELDATMVEINPLIVTEEGTLLALDAKMSFDDNALFRRPDIAELRDKSQEDPRETQAADRGLSYVGLEGDIGCIVNGAGLAMATMDMAAALASRGNFGFRAGQTRLARKTRAARSRNIPKPISSPRGGRACARRDRAARHSSKTGAIMTTPITETKPTDKGGSRACRGRPARQ